MPSLETANIGKAVAARVGTNIREVRTKLGMTQAQLAAPEFSISYISAIERGKIRPSLKALSVLARRLDVPLTFLLEGSPSGAAEARAVGYSPAEAGPDQRVDVDLLQADVLVQQGAFKHAEELLFPIQPERITTDQVYRLYLLRGEAHVGSGEYQEAIVDLRSALSQGESLNDAEYTERARNLLGKAYFALLLQTPCSRLKSIAILLTITFDLETWKRPCSTFITRLNCLTRCTAIARVSRRSICKSASTIKRRAKW